MFYSINISNDFPSSLIRIILHFNFFLLLMIVADTIARKKSVYFSTIILCVIIFIIIIVALAFSEEFRKLDLNEVFFMIIIVIYIALKIKSYTSYRFVISK